MAGSPRQRPGRQGNDVVPTLPFYPFEIRANGSHIVVELLRVVFTGLIAIDLIGLFR